MSALGFGSVLVVLWVLLWGSLSVANVVSGVLVVAAVLWLAPDVVVRRGRPTVRPVPLARLAVRLVLELLRANTVLTREILSRGSSIRTGVVAVPLPHCSDGMLTLVANVLALTPGTMPLEVRKQPEAAIYIHVLHLGDVENVRRDVQSLAALAVRAFGSAAAVAALTDPASSASIESIGPLGERPTDPTELTDPTDRADPTEPEQVAP